jgi:PilZ domain
MNSQAGNPLSSAVHSSEPRDPRTGKLIDVLRRLKDWMLGSSERRRSPRYEEPALVAYYWDGSVPLPHEVRNISSTGIYVRTTERWYPGTIVELRVNRELGHGEQHQRAESVVLHCKVVRDGADGVGLRFISLEAQERKALTLFVANVIATVSRRRSAMKQLGTVRATISHGLSE